MLVRGLRVWPGVLLGAADGQGLASFQEVSANAVPVYDAAARGIAFAVGGTLGALLVCALARRLLSKPLTLLRPREIGLFVFVVIPLGALSSVAFELPLQWMLVGSSDSMGWEEIASSGLGTLLATLVCVPLALVIAGAPRDLWHRRRWMGVVLPVLCVVILWGRAVVSQSLEKVEVAEFRETAAKVASRFELELATFVHLAEEYKAFFASSTLVERDEFGSFSRTLLARSPSVQAVSWEPRITESEVAPFEAAARQQGFTAFRVTEATADGARVPVTPRADYFPVWFLEPSEGNQAAFGFDLGSEPVRRHAIDAARGSGRLTATAPIRLVQAFGEPGVLLLTPIYSNTTGEFEGCVSVVANIVRASAGIERLAREASLRCAIVDPEAPSADSLLFASPLAAPLQHGALSRLAWKHELSIGGRTWSIAIEPSAAYRSSVHYWEALASGALVALTLALIVSVSLFTTGRDFLVEAVVRERSDELRLGADRLRALLESAPTALLAVSAGGYIVMANAHAIALLGVARDQVLGQQLDRLFPNHSDGQPRANDQSTSMPDLLANGNTADAGSEWLGGREVTVRRADGRAVRLELRRSQTQSGEQQLTVVALIEPIDAA